MQDYRKTSVISNEQAGTLSVDQTNGLAGSVRKRGGDENFVHGIVFCSCRAARKIIIQAMPIFRESRKPRPRCSNGKMSCPQRIALLCSAASPRETSPPHGELLLQLAPTETCIAIRTLHVCSILGTESRVEFLVRPAASFSATCPRFLRVGT